jgi:hypothetical protein
MRNGSSAARQCDVLSSRPVEASSPRLRAVGHLIEPPVLRRTQDLCAVLVMSRRRRLVTSSRRPADAASTGRRF